MSPSVIVLNACVVAFAALSVFFVTFLVAQARKTRQQKVVHTAKQVPLYQKNVPVEAAVSLKTPSYKLAEAE